MNQIRKYILQEAFQSNANRPLSGSPCFMVNNDTTLDFIAFFDLVTQIRTEDFNQVKRSGIGLGCGFKLQLILILQLPLK